MNRADEPIPRVTVVCALIEQAGRVLAAKRASGKVRAGKWEFPGGKIHTGESGERAIVREVAEELGCVIRVSRRLPETEHRYADLDVTLVPFTCALAEGTPRALEHDEIRWVDASDFRALDWVEADLPIAAAYFSAKQ